MPGIFQLLASALREQVVGDTYRERSGAGQLVHDSVVLRVVLEATAGIDRASHAQPFYLAYELTRRVGLVLARQARSLGRPSMCQAEILVAFISRCRR